MTLESSSYQPESPIIPKLKILPTSGEIFRRLKSKLRTAWNIFSTPPEDGSEPTHRVGLSDIATAVINHPGMTAQELDDQLAREHKPVYDLYSGPNFERLGEINTPYMIPQKQIQTGVKVEESDVDHWIADLP